MNSVDFGGHGAKMKVMMGIIDKYWVRGDATLCVIIFTSWCVNNSTFSCFHRTFYFNIMSAFSRHGGFKPFHVIEFTLTAYILCQPTMSTK